MNPVLVEVLRSGTVESRHAGALAVSDAAGVLRLSLGDIERPVFPRSAVKLLQALPLVESGAADRWQLDPEELALCCSSHNGEDVHVETAAGLLAKAGAAAALLECGAHWPLLDTAQRALARRADAPGPLHNNCSGKHAGFLCLAALRAAEAGESLTSYAAGYVRSEHPVMREVSAALAQTTGTDLDAAPRGVDGCSIPTYALPLRHLALGFARVATGIGLPPARARAAERLRGAIALAPYMVAGEGRFDTRVMQSLGERACVKSGAEGVLCAALPQQGLGVAIKMDDGTGGRAAEVVMACVLQALLPLDDAQAGLLADLAGPRLRNWNGIEVGRLRATEALQRGLA